LAARVTLYVGFMNQDRLILEALSATIARSPIMVAHQAVRLPPGYDEVEIVVLQWIAAEGRRIGRAIPVM
jgi:hypothetical protein